METVKLYSGDAIESSACLTNTDDFTCGTLKLGVKIAHRSPLEHYPLLKLPSRGWCLESCNNMVDTTICLHANGAFETNLPFCKKCFCWGKLLLTPYVAILILCLCMWRRYFCTMRMYSTICNMYVYIGIHTLHCVACFITVGSAQPAPGGEALGEC